MAIKTIRAQNNIGEVDIAMVGEILPITWDFAAELVAADSEVVTAAALAVYDGADTDVTDDVIVDDEIVTGDSTNSKVVVVLSMLAATTYKLVITATVSANKVLKAVVYIPCITP